MPSDDNNSDILVKFPDFRKELIAMADEDQAELRGNLHRVNSIKSKVKKQEELDKLFLNCHIRAKRMLEILEEIREPSISNIGTDGCEALLLITQHSYLSAMKRVLQAFRKQLNKDPASVPTRYLPALIDRIMVLEERKQKYGTQWSVTEDNVPILIPVEDFDNMNKRRSKYGLKPVRMPVNLAEGAVKYPYGRRLAKADDQKELTNEEYQMIAHRHLKSMI